MLKRSMKLLGISMIMVLGLMTAKPILANASVGEWKHIDTAWYYYEDGVKQTGWILDHDMYYYLDEEGVMQLGWIQVGGKWYYLTESGSLFTGWLYQKGQLKTYYLDYETGAMQVGWYNDGLNWYYFDSNGLMKTGWVFDSNTNKWYYIDKGRMVVGNENINGKLHEFAQDGTWLREISGSESIIYTRDEILSKVKALDWIQINPNNAKQCKYSVKDANGNLCWSIDFDCSNVCTREDTDMIVTSYVENGVDSSDANQRLKEMFRMIFKNNYDSLIDTLDGRKGPKSFKLEDRIITIDTDSTVKYMNIWISPIHQITENKK